MESSVSKTMLLVGAFFAISQAPYNVHLLLMTLNQNFFTFSGYYSTMSFVFLYICTNPFIYAIKFDPVKQALLRLNPCKNHSSVQAVETIGVIPT